MEAQFLVNNDRGKINLKQPFVKPFTSKTNFEPPDSIDNIQAVKAKMHEKNCIPPGQLEDGHTSSNYNIKNKKGKPDVNPKVFPVSYEIKVRLPRSYNATVTVNRDVSFGGYTELNSDLLNGDLLKSGVKKVGKSRGQRREWYSYQPNSCGAIVLKVINENQVKVVFFEEEFYRTKDDIYQKCAELCCRRGLLLREGDIVSVTRGRDASYKIKDKFQYFGWRNGCKNYSDDDLIKAIGNYVTEKQNSLLERIVDSRCGNYSLPQQREHLQYSTDVMTAANLLLLDEDICFLEEGDQNRRVERGLEIMIQSIKMHTIVNDFYRSFQFDGINQRMLLSKMPFLPSDLNRILLRDLLYSIAVDSESKCPLPYELMDHIAGYVSCDSQIICEEIVKAFLFQVHLADRGFDGLGDLKRRPFLCKFLHKVVSKWANLECQRMKDELISLRGYSNHSKTTSFSYEDLGTESD